MRKKRKTEGNVCGKMGVIQEQFDGVREKGERGYEGMWRINGTHEE